VISYNIQKGEDAMETKITWNGGMSFTGIGSSGHEVRMDAAPDIGGENTGARPMEMLLHSLGGCTGIDILMILKKMRLEVKSFRMDIKGNRADDHPKRFTTLHLHYALEGDLPVDKVRRAIDLSRDKYCSVSKSLNADITTSFSINGKSLV
jgi:putative redox protein